ncbi:MAG: hypothetical protein Crog4KO_18790 [Crocinitomicaceae bacterium]
MSFLVFAIVIGIVYLLFKNFSMSGRYAKLLDGMTDDELMRERNRVVSRINGGYSFIMMRSQCYKSMCIIDL